MLLCICQHHYGLDAISLKKSTESFQLYGTTNQLQ